MKDLQNTPESTYYEKVMHRFQKLFVPKCFHSIFHELEADVFWSPAPIVAAAS